MRSKLPPHRFGGVFFDLICAAFFWLLASRVTAAADTAARDPEGRVLWLGMLLLLAMALETWALPAKMRRVRSRLPLERREAGGGFFLWIFHVVVSIVVLFVAIGAFGWKVGEPGVGMPWPVGVLTVAMVLKELAVWVIAWGGSEELSGTTGARPDWTELRFDLILTLWACLAYSVTWEMVAMRLEMARHNPPEFAIDLVAMGLSFLAFYLPLRIPYLVEEWGAARGVPERLAVVGSIGVALVAALKGLGS